MNSIKTFRDELAISLPHNLIPEIKTPEALMQVAKKFNIKIDADDPLSLIEFAINYQAIMRYKYADAMLAASNRAL